MAKIWKSEEPEEREKTEQAEKDKGGFSPSIKAKSQRRKAPSQVVTIRQGGQAVLHCMVGTTPGTRSVPKKEREREREREREETRKRSQAMAFRSVCSDDAL